MRRQLAKPETLHERLDALGGLAPGQALLEGPFLGVPRIFYTCHSDINVENGKDWAGFVKGLGSFGKRLGSGRA